MTDNRKEYFEERLRVVHQELRDHWLKEFGLDVRRPSNAEAPEDAQYEPPPLLAQTTDPGAQYHCVPTPTGDDGTQGDQ